MTNNYLPYYKTFGILPELFNPKTTKGKLAVDDLKRILSQSEISRNVNLHLLSLKVDLMLEGLFVKAEWWDASIINFLADVLVEMKSESMR